MVVEGSSRRRRPLPTTFGRRPFLTATTSAGCLSPPSRPTTSNAPFAISGSNVAFTLSRQTLRAKAGSNVVFTVSGSNNQRVQKYIADSQSPVKRLPLPTIAATTTSNECHFQRLHTYHFERLRRLVTTSSDHFRRPLPLPLPTTMYHFQQRSLRTTITTTLPLPVPTTIPSIFPVDHFQRPHFVPPVLRPLTTMNSTQH
jgi:hypothetical protein